MSWTRSAGGWWLGPNGELKQVTHHGPVAYDILLKELTFEHEGKKPKVEEGPSGPDVKQVGKSYSEAIELARKELASRGMSDENSPRASEVLEQEHEWVRVSRDVPDCEYYVDASCIENVRNVEVQLSELLSRAKGPMQVATHDGARITMTKQELDQHGDIDSLITSKMRSPAIAGLRNPRSEGWGSPVAAQIHYFIE